MIPSLVGRMPLGKSSSHPLAETGGSEMVALTTAQMPSHNHSSTISINEGGEHTHNLRMYSNNGSSMSNVPRSSPSNPQFDSGYISAGGSHTHTATSSISKTGSDQPHPNMPPYISLNMIIKT